MQVSIKRETLIKPLNQVAGIVERRQTLPILSNLLVQSENGTIKMTGTDLEVEVITHSSAEIKVSGETTLPARKLLDICRALPDEADINIAIEGEKAVIRSGKSRFTLLTMVAGEFPNLEAGGWDLSIELSQKVLKGLFERTQFCMAQQDVRYYLNGLLLEFEGKRLRAVGTDGHRMALSDVQLETDTGAVRQVIVPRKGINELVRFLEDSDEKVMLQVGTNHIRANLPTMVFTSKLIDGRFPDYTKVIPANQTKVVEIDRDTFKDALHRAAILSNEKYRGIRFSVETGLMKITAHNPEQEEAEEELAVSYSGDTVEIGFNSNYMMDAVNALAGPKVEMGLTDGNSSGTLRAPGDEHTRYVIMPMRL